MIDENNITRYYEPFCGGCNVIDKIKCAERYASDSNKYLIALFKYLQEFPDGLPSQITREEYKAVRKDWQNNNIQCSDWFVGAVGYLASYNAKFFGGYAGKVNTKIGTVRDYYDEAKRNLESQISNLLGVHFSCCDYRECIIPDNSIIYCDIPYKDTTDYKTDFDHDAFWMWAKTMSKNNIVVVSEENAPLEWTSIWSKQIGRTMDNASRSKSVENLFIINNQKTRLFERGGRA